RGARRFGKPVLILIDYLQMMKCPGKENRTNEISEISRSLKALAKEFDCPVVALSQLNRELERRPNKRPINADLRESGALEQDADLILFVYRDEVYNPDSEQKGIAELILSKHRNGALGTVRTAFIPHHTRFENLSAAAWQGARS
ncbi:DnaB-like helicase C-terminal domain-containing protein, partial [Pseudomonas amygdali pv. tabaci]